MVEYVIESILSLALAREILNVVNNQHVNALIEVEEVIYFTHGVKLGKLALKQACCNIKHSCHGVVFLDAYTDSLYQVSLAATAGTKEKQGIESAATWVLGNGLGYRACYLVAHA